MSYEEQLSAAKFRAERDQARQEVKELREELDAASKDALRSEIVDQSMDNIEREIKLGVNSIAELLEIGGEIQELPIAEVCPRIVAELEKRLMPKGYEWPRYEDGEPVLLGSMVADACSGSSEVWAVEFCGDIVSLWSDMGSRIQILSTGERAKRPAVLAADGEPLGVGQTVWDVRGIRQFRVLSIAGDGEHGEYIVETVGVDRMGLSGWSRPSDLTHKRPVMGADGAPIKVGDTVWDVESGTELDVLDVYGVAVDEDFPDHTVRCRRAGAEDYESTMCVPSRLTHTEPEPPDSWERIEGDALAMLDDGLHPNDEWVLDLVGRCRALAERGA